MDTKSIMMAVQDRLPKNADKIQNLQDRLNHFDDKSKNELLSQINDETFSPFKGLLFVFVVEVVVLIIAYFALFDWLGFRINGKVGFFYVIAVLLGVFILFKIQSIVREINIENIEEAIAKKEKDKATPSRKANLGAAAVGAAVGVAAASQMSAQEQTQNTTHTTNSDSGNEIASKVKDGFKDEWDKRQTNDEEQDDDTDSGDDEGGGLLSAIFDD